MDYAKARNRIINRIKISDSGCWEYSLKVRSNGYARITFLNNSWYAHRLSFVAFNEVDYDISDKDVCHSCDNRKCVNPSHLFLGTRQDNMNDALSKNRQAKGAMLPQTKLFDGDIIEIMKMVNSGIKYKEIALKFKVTPQLIGKIAIKNGVRRR